MNFIRQLLQNSKLCTITGTIGGHQVMRKLCVPTHQVTEEELQQYVENVTSTLGHQSFTVGVW